MKKLSALLALAFLFVGCSQSENAPIRSIKVSGTHKETITPDLYKCHLFIKQNAVEKETAIKALEQTRAELYQIVKNANLPDSSIKPQSISVRKQQKWENGVSQDIGFIAEQSFIVSIAEKQKTTDFVKASTLLNDFELRYIEPTLSSPENTKNEISAKALALAMKKAESLAQSVNAKIGKPIHISEENFQEPRFHSLSLAKNNVTAYGREQNLGEDFSASIEMESTIFLTVELNF